MFQTGYLEPMYFLYNIHYLLLCGFNIKHSIDTVIFKAAYNI